MHRIFILSPAHTGGRRAQILLRERARFDLAQQLRLKTVPLGEVFSFLSGLYFRGKMAYARTFAKPPPGMAGILVITSNRGLLNADHPIDFKLFQNFSTVDIDEENPKYRRPLVAAARKLAGQISEECEIVLLGSVATGKYVNVLQHVFQERLVFPTDFIGRGDMSRGGLMLRCAADKTELEYISTSGANRRGTRPEKLTPRRYSKTL